MALKELSFNGAWERKRINLASLASLAAIGTYVFFRLHGLTADHLWFDEMFSVDAARRGWGDLLAFIAEDAVHPPLFYLLLKAWITIGGESLLWLRLLPVLLSILALIPLSLLCRELKLRPAETNLAIALMAVNGFLAYYAREVRMYSLLFLLTACALLTFWRVLRGSPRLALFLADLLLVYTHYYGWLIVGGQLLFAVMSDRKRAKVWMAFLVALASCFVPWAFAVAKNLLDEGGSLEQNLGWLTRPSFYRLMTTYATFNGQLGFRFNVSLGLALFLAPVLISAYRIFRSGGRSSLYPPRSSVFAEMERSRREERSAFAFLCFFAFIPILSLFAVCQAIPQMIWLPRGLIIAAAPYLMLVSMAVHRFGSRLVRGGVLCALLCWASAAGFKSLDQIDYRKIDWGRRRADEASWGSGKGANDSRLRDGPLSRLQLEVLSPLG